ncbi:MAG TPA: hypothetical protein VN777_06135 [Terriglobales bacterium]|nr:hypothetical protein [Terriglobales bacterium]
MRLPFCLNAISRVALLAAASTASAQDIFVTPIPGVPFSGLVKVERSLTQPDGSIVNRKTMRDIGRDSRGRIHNESRALVPVSDIKTPQIESIHLYDPQTRISAMLNPQERTFWTQTVNRPPATVPPALFGASPTGDNLPQNEFTKKEDLGIRDIEGLPAHGIRETQTIPAESSGRGKEIVITDEYWYSDDLRINLMIKHSDPRMGTVTLTVAQITRTEPDPALFEIPHGYRRVGTN